MHIHDRWYNKYLPKKIILNLIKKYNKKGVTIEEFCYKNKNPLINLYFNGLLKSAIDISRYWEKTNPLILDFGCNCQQLKKILNNKHKDFRYVGYDVDKKYSDINDYKELKPDYIFSINVLEHLDIKKLDEMLKNFRRMNKEVKIITSIPTMNFLSNLSNTITQELQWEGDEFGEHKSEFRDIQNVFRRKCKLIKTKNYMFMQRIQVWKFS